MTEIDVEYAIEVPGRGYVSSTFSHITLADEPVCMNEHADATSILADIKKIYIDMGCSDIAETIRLISRPITVTRGEWSPVIVETEAALKGMS